MSEQCVVDELISAIMRQCNECRAKHEKLDFRDELEYSRAVKEMVQVKVMAKYKLIGWIEDSRSFYQEIINESLTTSYRRYLHFQAQASKQANSQQVYLELCKLRGLVWKDVDERNELEETPLMEAAVFGRSQQDVTYLIRAKSNIDAKAKDSKTALYLAAQNGHEQCIRTLIELRQEQGFDPTLAEHQGQSIENSPDIPSCASLEQWLALQEDSEGLSPVHIAAQVGNHECITLLVGFKASVNANNQHATALHQAVHRNQQQCAELLLRLGAFVDAVDEDGATPLHWVVHFKPLN
mmetsp:Transcript_88537/g.235619  ORF Transcript_88537/g.235619 Transcript_88537/m.235619 type:complete len:296 (+) Transcript_88537:853-1740(+)